MPFGRNFILKTSAWKPVERLVRRSFIFRPVVRRFIAGDTLADAMTCAEELCHRGFGVSLDYLGENTKDKSEAEKAVLAFTQMLEEIAKCQMRAQINISIKLTQCGLDVDETFAEENFKRVLQCASSAKSFVRVDMEASEYTERTIAMIERVFHTYPETGTVLQSYLHRTTEDIARLMNLGSRIRIVKGAYLEPESIAYQSKDKVDEMYLQGAKTLLQGANYPAIATHDVKIISELKRFVADNSIDKSSFEWQMLYGIRRDLQDELLKEGFKVRIYVPFGDQWYPYFTRRLAERPANLLFFLKSIFKG